MFQLFSLPPPPKYERLSFWHPWPMGNDECFSFWHLRYFGKLPSVSGVNIGLPSRMLLFLASPTFWKVAVCIGCQHWGNVAGNSFPKNSGTSRFDPLEYVSFFLHAGLDQLQVVCVGVPTWGCNNKPYRVTTKRKPVST